MKLGPLRLLELLQPDGFMRGLFDPRTRDYHYVRPGLFAETFEHIRVKCGGKAGEVAWANAGVSCVKRSPSRGLIELELMRELATDGERGWADIGSADRARRWEDRLAAIASARATELSRQKAPGLLKRTEEARAMAREYLAQVFEKAGDDALGALTVAQAELVSRILDAPGVVLCEELRPAYARALSSLASLNSEASRLLLHAISEDPLKSETPLWCVHILCDRLSGESP